MNDDDGLDSCRRIDFSNVSEDSMEHLSRTCDKATFGRNNEDVLDNPIASSVDVVDALHCRALRDEETARQASLLNMNLKTTRDSPSRGLQEILGPDQDTHG